MKKMKKIPFWLPLGIIAVMYLLDAFLRYYLAPRLIEIHTDIDVNLFYYKQLAYILFFFLSYFLTLFVVKKNKYGLGFLFLCMIALMIPFFIGKTGFDYYSFQGMYGAIKSIGFAILFFWGFDWFNKQKLAKELEKQNLQSELSLLKNQVNPHFLFNTLNNIDSLVKKNPDCASQSIVELSEMMRYMLYEANVDKVPLQKELDYIDNYLNLQKLQYFNEDLVEYAITGIPGNMEIAPMLFIPFIENAFKHCTNKEVKQAIRFSFLLEYNKIRFEAINISDKTQIISKDKTGGIGLETIKRRLEILYPNRYSLVIQEKNDLFCVSLAIQVDD